MPPWQAWHWIFNLFIFKGLFLFYVYEFACVHMCPTFTPNTKRGQKQALGHLKLELLVAVSCYAGAGNWTLVLWKEQPSAFNGWAISLAPTVDIYTWSQPKNKSKDTGYLKEKITNSMNFLSLPSRLLSYNILLRACPRPASINSDIGAPCPTLTIVHSRGR